MVVYKPMSNTAEVTAEDVNYFPKQGYKVLCDEKKTNLVQ